MIDYVVQGIVEGRPVGPCDREAVQLSDIGGKPSPVTVICSDANDVMDACISARSLETDLASLPTLEIIERIEAAGERFALEATWPELVAVVTGSPIAHVRDSLESARAWMRGIRRYVIAAFGSLEAADARVVLAGSRVPSSGVIHVPGGTTGIVPAGDDAGLPAFAVVQALLARCPVVVKPSLREPVSSQELVRTLLEVGLGRFVQLVPWDAARSPELGPILFKTTSQAVVFGSDQTVRSLSSDGAPGAVANSRPAPGRVVAHTTGRSGAIVLDDVDPWSAAKSIVQGAIWNRGTECVCTKTAYVQAGVWGPLLAAILETEGALRLGEPTDPATDLSHIPARDRVAIAGCLAAAEVLCGRTVGDVMSLHVVLDDRNDSVFVREELPGPVLALVKVASAQDAVHQANSVLAPGRSRTCVSIFSHDRSSIFGIARAVRAHTIRVNQPTAPPDWFAMHDGRYLVRELMHPRGLTFAGPGDRVRA